MEQGEFRRARDLSRNWMVFVDAKTRPDSYHHTLPFPSSAAMNTVNLCDITTQDGPIIEREAFNITSLLIGVRLPTICSRLMLTVI